MLSVTAYNRVETERVIPKLELQRIKVRKTLIKPVLFTILCYLQEFQYGKETVRFNLHQLMY